MDPSRSNGSVPKEIGKREFIREMKAGAKVLKATVFNEPGVRFTEADFGKSISIRLKSGSSSKRR